MSNVDYNVGYICGSGGLILKTTNAGLNWINVGNKFPIDSLPLGSCFAINQNIVFIPHDRLIHMIQYKCELVSINVILTEESYTSKCSFFDNEENTLPALYRTGKISQEVYAGTSRFVIR